MEAIQMVDLQRQTKRIRMDLDAAIAEAINQGQFIQGSQVKDFAQKLAEWNDSKHVVPVANGTDGLQVAMMALGLKPGDEVIVPVFTYVATAEVLALLGLKPVFIDVDSVTFNLDVKQLESVLTPQTKAIVPVHLFGQMADMISVMAFAKAHDLWVIEDNAQAIGASHFETKSGNYGHLSVTSFFPSKNLGCFGDGGAVFSNDSELAERVRVIANHGQRVKYYHDEVGVNSRLDTLQAAILNVKLPHLHSYIQHRQTLASHYDQAFAGISALSTPEILSGNTHVYHQYTLQIKDGRRDQFKQFLQEKGIPSMIYYPVPLHLQKAYAGLAKEGDFPVAERLCQEVLSLPMHTEMDEAQRAYIIDQVSTFFK